VCVTWGPADVKLSLLDAVLDLVVAHVHSIGPFLENFSFGNSICCVIVCFELCCILWMSHSPESFSRYSASFGIDKATEETTCFRTVDWHSRGGHLRGAYIGSACCCRVRIIRQCVIWPWVLKDKMHHCVFLVAYLMQSSEWWHKAWCYNNPRGA
jgi:hypothetical protein